MNLENITFGIELETIVPRASNISVGGHGYGRPVETALTPLGASIPAPAFNGHYWKADGDPSITSAASMKPCEWVSPVLKGEAGVRHVLDFLSFLKAIGTKVNSSCGCHIHIGVQGVAETEEGRLHFVKILTRLVNRKATALYAQTGTTSRENGRWCAMAGESYRQAVNRAGRSKSLQNAARVNTRYHLLNLQSLPEHGTVEFRCFAGTLNPAKVLLHLFSVLTFVRQAAERKGLLSWADPREQFTGSQMVKNVLRPSNFAAVFPTFREHQRAIVLIAMEMAAKYDTEKGTPTAAPARRSRRSMPAGDAIRAGLPIVPPDFIPPSPAPLPVV